MSRVMIRQTSVFGRITSRRLTSTTAVKAKKRLWTQKRRFVNRQGNILHFFAKAHRCVTAHVRARDDEDDEDIGG